MDNSDDARFATVLARQLEMNKVTFARLEEHGVTSDSELRLDFSYLASSEAAARELVQLLETETDYEVHVRFLDEPAPTWLVEGTTQPTTVSLEILDQWVKWMVTAGAHHKCEFDGWGAEL